MITRLRAAAGSIFGWGTAVVSAFLGTRFSADQRFTASIWAVAAFGLLAASAWSYSALRWRTTKARKDLERQVAIESQALFIGRRAQRTYMSIIDNTGTARGMSLARLLTDAPDEGGVIGWSAPMAVRFHLAIQHPGDK